MAEGFLGGFGDFLTGGGIYADPKAINPTYGVPEGDVRQAAINQLSQLSALALAAGQPMEGSQRAQLLAQMGQVGGQFNTNLYNAAQRRLMTSQMQQQQSDIEELNVLRDLQKKDPEGLAKRLGPQYTADIVRSLPVNSLRDVVKSVNIAQLSRDPIQQQAAALTAMKTQRELEQPLTREVGGSLVQWNDKEKRWDRVVQGTPTGERARYEATILQGMRDPTVLESPEYSIAYSYLYGPRTEVRRVDIFLELLSAHDVSAFHHAWLVVLGVHNVQLAHVPTCFVTKTSSGSTSGTKGLVFFLDFQYGQNKELSFGPAGDVYSTGSLYGLTNPGPSADAEKGLYGAGRFGYSINQKSASLNGTVTKATWAQVEYDATLSASIAAGVTYSALSINMSSLTGSGQTKPDFKGVRAFVATSASIATTSTILPQYTSVNESTGTVTFIHYAPSSSFASLSPTNCFVLYNVQPTDNYRGDFEDATGAGYPNAESTAADALAIPQIDIKMKSEAIVAKTRKLKAQWTPEFAQDLNAYQSLDAEAELTSIMSEYIALEIDLENLDMLIQDASAWDEYWSAKNNNYLNSTKTAWANDLDFYNTQGQWFQTLVLSALKCWSIGVM